MAQASVTTRQMNPIRAWLAEFLLSRGFIAGPNEKPLYSYQVTADEFGNLRHLLTNHRDHADHPLYGKLWAAAFCLFVAESYRREYGGGDDGWTWTGFERRISCNLTQQLRTELVQQGLSYWRRPVRQRDGRRDLLGSLCLEGGLPWQLVQSETHGFGRVVRRGLKYFYRTEGGSRTTADLIADCEQYLPLTFRDLNSRQLLAGIVEQLMYLGRKYPLKDQPDPADYLDRHVAGWRSEFPVPLDESNARSLINDWLRDAGTRNQERLEAIERERGYTCEHRLLGGFSDWRIRTELTIPNEEMIAVDHKALGSTRLSLAFFEGERLLKHGGAVYGQLTEGSLKVRYPTGQFGVDRRNISEPLSLRLLESGRPVHIVQLDGTALDLNEIPLVFESRDEQRWLAATASCSLAAQSVWIRVPPDGHWESGVGQELAREPSGAIWIESTENITLRRGADIYKIELNSRSSTADIPSINGHYALFDSIPGTVFLGWPKLELHEGCSYTLDQLGVFSNGRRVPAAPSRKRAGIIRYSVRTGDGQTLLQRRFGILPEGFSLAVFPAFKDQPARVIAKNAQGVDFRIKDHNLSAHRSETEQGVLIQLHCHAQTPPASFELELNTESESEPVTLILDYPYRGARLIDSDNKPSDASELMIDDLIGKRVALSSSALGGQDFHVQLELFNQKHLRVKRNYIVRVNDAPVLLNLYSYQNDIQQMLGAVDEQDAYVRFTVETDQRLLSLNIRRYSGILCREGGSAFIVQDMHGQRTLANAAVEAMLISDPKQTATSLAERTSQGVGTGCFEVSAEMERNGPWLIYPSKSSTVRFRPELYVPRGFEIESAGDVQSLHRATQLYHPIKNPNVIGEQMAAMAADLEHSGWQYLDDLRRHFNHLPLSTYQSWLALSSDNDSLATAVLRMEVDESFCARIRDELAVIWECVPLDTWVNAFGRFRAWLTERGLQHALIESLLDNRKKVLKSVVPAFEHLGNYLVTGDRPRQKPPLELILPNCYQDLRRNNESNDRWPIDLGETLADWVDRQPLPLLIRRLSNIEYSNAVTYLPIFMAHVTAGKVTTAALPGPPDFVKFVIRKISDFDRQGWYLYVHALVVWHLLTA
jgi:hypothetical protein